MRRPRLCAAILMLVMLSAMGAWASSAPTVSSDEAMTMLKEGNARFVSGSPTYPNQNRDRRTLTTTEGQHPFATILSCSDSRAPDEILFDRGVGDLFIIRVAGNVADVDEIGSIEYAVDHLGTPVLVVLGHTHCGAVTAVAEGAKLHGSIPPLVANIKPAVAAAKAADPKLSGDALVEAAVKTNVWQSIQDLLKTSPIVREHLKEGKVKIVGAIYDIDTGKVDWLGPHPDEAKLLAKYGVKDTGKKHKE